MAEEMTEVEVEETPAEEAVETESTETEIDWKAMARKHEGRAKKTSKELDELKARLKDIEDSNQSESEKAIAKAREEAKAEAVSEAEVERRADRLEVAVTRLAAKGVTVGDQTVRFADPEDALIFIERAIKADEAGDIFDDEGKVHTDALSDALADILKRKPNLAAGDAPRPKGSADAGKGSGSSELSDDPEDHFRRRRENK